MHFVSEHAGQKLIRTTTKIYSPSSGELIKTLPQVWLKLYRGRAPEWAVAAGEGFFNWATRPRPGMMGGADVPVESWMVYVDTVEWAEQLGFKDEDGVRLLAEAALKADPDFREVFPPVLVPPWPAYDDLKVTKVRTAQKVAEDNLLTAEKIGVTIEEMIEYERLVQNRAEVIGAYEAELEARPPADPEALALGVEA